MSAPGHPSLGRGVVVGAGQQVPGPWATAPEVVIDEDALEAPAAVLAQLRTAWAERRPVAVVCAVDPARFRALPSWRGEVYTLAADMGLAHEELHFNVWANTYDARSGEPVWWWGRKALRAGASPLPPGSPAGDVMVDGQPVWVDGGPRQPWPELPGGLGVVHRESVERGTVRPAPPWRGPTADLAADQLAAVAHDRGPARIIAPAGSGKTRVLTERLRHLLADRGWEPDAVLAVAYNKRAQQELESRCAGLPVRTRTLNSLGLWVLTEAAGRPPAVLGEREVRDLVRRLAPKQQRRANTDPFAPYIEALATVRLALVDPDAVEAARDDVPELARVLAGLRQHFADTGSVDFDEQVYGAVEALLGDGALRARLQARCRHLLVDEFQDLTPAHVLLLRLLAGPQADVFGVGDDDQVIYGHAGADPSFLIDYARLFPGAASHHLEVNYRCPPAVVTAASTLLGYNHRRVPKAIVAGRPATDVGAPDGLVVRRHAMHKGSAAVVEAVRGWLDAGASPADIAVLARVRAGLLGPVVALRSAGVPVDATVGAELLERTGVRAALAYLRLATGPERMDSADLVEVYRRPSRGLPSWFAERLRRRGSWQVDALGALPGVDDKVALKAARLADELAALRRLAARGADAVALLRHVRDTTGLGTAMSMLDSSGSEGSSHLDDLDALLEVAALHPDPTDLEAWLRHELGRRAEGPAVTASTVHRVKGLEWPYVAVAAVADGVLPHRLADDEEEERRILHVAITRSRTQTVVLADTGRPSPFVAELDGSAPAAPATLAGAARVASKAPAGAGSAPGSRAGRRQGAAATPSTRQVEARRGLTIAVSGGFEGPIAETDADGAMLRLESGAGLRVRWGETVRVGGRDLVLVAPADLDAETAAAEAALRAWRTARARRDRVAPFIVFADRTLRAIATARPATLVALLQVDGIGPTKLDLYGDEVLEVLATAGATADADTAVS